MWQSSAYLCDEVLPCVNSTEDLCSITAADNRMCQSDMFCFSWNSCCSLQATRRFFDCFRVFHWWPTEVFHRLWSQHTTCDVL